MTWNSLRRQLSTILFSKATTLISLSLFAICMAIATFIESKYGTPAAKVLVYNNLLFYLLQVLMIVNFVGIVWKERLLKIRKLTMLLIHAAFIVIMIGALVTRIFGYEGMIHLREGESSNQAVTQQTYLNVSIKSENEEISTSTPIVVNPIITPYFDEKYTINNQTIRVKLVESNLFTTPYKHSALKLSLFYNGKYETITLEGANYVLPHEKTIELGKMKLTASFGSNKITLPFSVKLNDFWLTRYPGSHSPSSYESDLEILPSKETHKETISMNKIIYQDAYRIYQTSFDPDEMGTVLSVNYDLAGTIISYAGYLMLLIGFILSFFLPGSRFQFLLARLKELAVHPTIWLILFFAFAFNLLAQEPAYVVDAAHASRFGKLMVQCPTGRLEPLNTYHTKLTRKILRSNNFNGLSSDQFVLSYMANPFYWNAIPIIHLNNVDLMKLLHVSEKDISFNTLFDQRGQYRLSTPVEQAYAKSPNERTALDKDLLKLDEKANILYSLQEFKMYAVFPLPNDQKQKWYSPGDDLGKFEGKDSMFVSQVFHWYMDEVANSLKSNNWTTPNQIADMMDTYQQAKSTQYIDQKRVEYELLYNKYELFSFASKLYLIFGLAMSLFAIMYLINRRRWLKVPIVAMSILLIGVFILHGAGIGLRWYISEQAPWSNAYESMIYIGWATMLAGLLFIKRSNLTMGLAAIFAGLVLFVANLNFMDPEITPLVPVLKSYWLMIHVAVITGSYGFFGVSFLLGLVSVGLTNFKRSNQHHIDARIEELTIINELSMSIGFALLSIGTFLGAVWANESWGRYWGWDPKETWALISIIVYAFILHARLIPRFRSVLLFNMMAIYGLSTVLMTYFGVNYYLSGMHSYGKGDTPPALEAILIIYGVVTLVVLFTWFRTKRNNV